MTEGDHLQATVNLNEQAIGTYCREQGIYSFQLKQWRDKHMNSKDEMKGQESELGELNELRKENKSLKTNLRRKDKALAEATALLELKKKQT